MSSRSLMSNNTPGSKQESVIRQAAIQNAYKVAAIAAQDAHSANKPGNSSEFVRISKKCIQLQMNALQAQLNLLEELESMTDDEKMEIIFRVLDKNNDGGVSAVELADGLRRVWGNVTFEESIKMAIERVAYFDKDGDAKLQLEEFKVYCSTLTEVLGADFHELAEMLIISVLFSDSGNDECEEFYANLLEDDIALAVKEEGALKQVLKDERMKALFHLFDLDCDFFVEFREIIVGLYKIVNDLGEATIQALGAIVVFDDDGNSRLDYTEFTRFILHLIQSQGSNFDEAILNLTTCASQQSDISPEDLTLILDGMGLDTEGRKKDGTDSSES